MRLAFVHEAVLRLEDGADARGPGGAVTVGLCGHWRHDGPCRWPHFATVSGREEHEMTLRVLFVAEPEDEPAVRTRIVDALRRGRVDGAPRPSAWIMLRDGSDALRPEEAAHAKHLAGR